MPHPDPPWNKIDKKKYLNITINHKSPTRPSSDHHDYLVFPLQYWDLSIELSDAFYKNFSDSDYVNVTIGDANPIKHTSKPHDDDVPKAVHSKLIGRINANYLDTQKFGIGRWKNIKFETITDGTHLDNHTDHQRLTIIAKVSRTKSKYSSSFLYQIRSYGVKFEVIHSTSKETPSIWIDDKKEKEKKKTSKGSNGKGKGGKKVSKGSKVAKSRSKRRRR